MNVAMLLDMAVDGFGDRVVVGRREDGLTPRELRARARCGAALLRAAASEGLVYLAVNGPAFPVAFFAAATAGVPVIPVNYRLGAEQLTAVLENHRGCVAVVDDAHREAAEEAGLAVRSPHQWMAETAQGPDSGDEEVDEAEVSPDSVAATIYTSGTTSAPKGVLLRHENLASYVLGTVDFAGAEAEDASLVSVPPYHIAAVSNTLTNLFAGRRAVVLETFTPRAWLETVRDQRVTHAMVVPTMLARMIDEPDADLDVPSLRSLAYGGAAMPRRVIEAALRAWPHVDFVNAYGLTETSSTISILGPEEHRKAVEGDGTAAARLASAGRPVPGIEVEIRGEDGSVLPTDEIGTIWVHGEQVSGRYAGRGPEIDERGFFNTRDRGRLDDEGYLFVGGRIDDTIIRGAENIAPAEIEDVLLSHPDVADAVVVGIPDDEWGQRIEAVVVARPGASLDPEEVRTRARAALRGSKTPERIEVWPEIPRSPVGKLIRRDVVDRLVGAGE
jgi:acyl-CoA synthetase (AMP-forming)/AMP-acid ligase II